MSVWARHTAVSAVQFNLTLDRKGFNIFPSTRRSHKWSVPYMIIDQNLICFSLSSMHATCPAHIIPQDLIFPTIFVAKCKFWSPALRNTNVATALRNTNVVTSSLLARIFAWAPVLRVFQDHLHHHHHRRRRGRHDSSIVKINAKPLWAFEVQNSCLSATLLCKFNRSSTDGSAYPALAVTSWRQRERNRGTEMGKYTGLVNTPETLERKRVDCTFRWRSRDIPVCFISSAVEELVCYSFSASLYLRALYVSHVT